MPPREEQVPQINSRCVRVWQEPVAFWGGVFAGALGLNVDEDPLRGWLQRTAADAQVL